MIRSRLADPPLIPSPDEARSWLRRELINPEYQREGVLQRAWDWVQGVLARAVDGAAGVGPLVAIVSMLVFALLTLGLVLLLSQARTNRRAAQEARAVIEDRRVAAAQLRARARAALAERRYDDAVVEGFRALTMEQIERGALDDLPGATAHEVATALETVFPGRRDEVERAAYLFDLVRYGDRRATRDQAETVLALEGALVGAR